MHSAWSATETFLNNLSESLVVCFAMVAVPFVGGSLLPFFLRGFAIYSGVENINYLPASKWEA